MNSGPYEPESEWMFDKNDKFLNYFSCAGDQPVYVDLGCAHPVNKSLTKICRDFHWRGVAVDGNPDYTKDWQEAGFFDHFHYAVLSSEPVARFAIHDNAFTSRLSPSQETDRPENWGIKRVVNVPTQSVNSILAARHIDKVDLLCVDLEGAEMEVLQTLDFEKHDPKFIISEFITHGEGTDPRVFNFLIAKGYRAVFMSESNIIYTK